MLFCSPFALQPTKTENENENLRQINCNRPKMHKNDTNTRKKVMLKGKNI